MVMTSIRWTFQAGGKPLVRLYADTTDCRVLLPEEEDSVLRGTAIVACLAAGLHGLMSDAAQVMRRSRATLEPNVATRALVADQYRRFLRMQNHRREPSRPVEGCSKPGNRPTLPQGRVDKTDWRTIDVSETAPRRLSLP
jgi:hypothetical protein